MKHLISLLLPLSLTLSIHAQEYIPNSIKYRDTSVPNGTGRSGSASIETRALAGKNGAVDLEVTTGSLEAGTAPGQLEKVKVKQPDSDWSVNYTNLASGGVMTAAIGAFPRGTALSVTANVSGIDPYRVDVVTVSETVKLRPDLSVALLAPGKPIPGIPHAIEATVRELNGDVGARANCVLYVDDAEVDRAPGIWVDAGSTVTCAFSHAFTAGTHQLRVEAAAVNPGDFEPANNSASAEVTAGFQTFDSWYAQAEQSTSTTDWRLTSDRYSAQQFTTQFNSYAAFNGTVWAPFAHLENITGSMRFSSDGIVLDEVPAIPLRRTYHEQVSDDDGQYIEGCIEGQQEYQVLRACGWSRFNDGVWTGGGTLFVQSMAGEVTFHSEGFDSRDEPDFPAYTWNWDRVHRRFGNRTPWGNTVTLEVALTDGEVTVSASPTLALQPFTTESQWSHCYWPWWGETCESNTFRQSGVRALLLSGF